MIQQTALTEETSTQKTSENIDVEVDQEEEEGIELGGEKYKFATMNRRLIASVLDMMVILIFLGPILNGINYYIYKGKTPQQILEEFGMKYHNMKDGTLMMQYLNSEGIVTKYLLAQFIALIIFAIFMIAFWKWKGATPGKMITRCVIVDAKTGKTPSVKQSIIRFLGYIVSSIPLCIGFLVIPITKKKQGFHDMMANTVVIVKPWKKKAST